MKKIVFILSLLFLGACTFPQDPQHSFKEAKKEDLLVGITINPPFTIKEKDSFFGKEVRLIRKFAESENLSIQFMEGSESELVKKLEKFKLHLVIGGFEKKTIWKKKAGLSAPYDQKHVIMVPKGENRLLQKVETFIFHQKNKG
ncbi:amino acid ABC transporter substrate-binding protein (PAAT family) [Salegentibacter sp. 24]|uniref:transporter substrate-binding domain-containing protein n=1 Tax=Salegentibacter sp. 24 TaxID=2183986 RepID=UPI0010D1B48F|nr:transporter substrate-binding domain-containing protein [Salegentibacter sp. 24]TDN94942.1 amino acid ABC transporter substrate-binding protein (PAAT family) [Salegentibacter sp. 24]